MIFVFLTRRIPGPLGWQSRGLALPGFGRYPDVPSQLRRMAGEGGWDRALAADLFTLYQHFLTPEQRKR